MFRIIARQASSAAITVTHSARVQAVATLKARNGAWMTTLGSRRFISIGEVRFTKDHEWIRLEKDSIVTIGVTNYAQDSLGDITYAEIEPVGENKSLGDVLGFLESSKAASDILSPCAGQIAIVNEDMCKNSPETINNDPMTNGWLLKMKISDAAQLDNLMTEADYKAFTEDGASSQAHN